MRFPTALLASLVCLGACAAAAPAATVTIGSPITSPLFEPTDCSAACTVLTNGLVNTSTQAAAPFTGTIVRWRIREADGGQPYRLRVLNRGEAGNFTSTASSPVGVPAGPGLETFAANIPIVAGQVIGLDVPAGAHVGFISGSGGIYGYLAEIAPEGVPTPFELGAGEVAFNADVQPPPTVTAVAPPKGSIAGDSEVMIAGTDFTGVTAVSFGGVQAPTFSVTSEAQLTATVPKAKKPGPAEITVTTIAGASAPAATKFTYTACIVPKLIGQKVKADRKKLRKAGCKLGKVRGEQSRGAKVVKQTQKPGKILPAGAKIGVKVEE